MFNSLSLSLADKLKAREEEEGMKGGWKRHNCPWLSAKT